MTALALVVVSYAIILAATRAAIWLDERKAPR